MCTPIWIQNGGGHERKSKIFRWTQPRRESATAFIRGDGPVLPVCVGFQAGAEACAGNCIRVRGQGFFRFIRQGHGALLKPGHAILLDFYVIKVRPSGPGLADGTPLSKKAMAPTFPAPVLLHAIRHGNRRPMLVNRRSGGVAAVGRHIIPRGEFSLTYRQDTIVHWLMKKV